MLHQEARQSIRNRRVVDLVHRRHDVRDNRQHAHAEQRSGGAVLAPSGAGNGYAVAVLIKLPRLTLAAAIVVFGVDVGVRIDILQHLHDLHHLRVAGVDPETGGLTRRVAVPGAAPSGRAHGRDGVDDLHVRMRFAQTTPRSRFVLGHPGIQLRPGAELVVRHRPDHVGA